MSTLNFTYRAISLFLLALSLVLSFPSSTLAWEWDGLWDNTNQQGNKAFVREDYQDAAFLFEDIAWRAAANYRQGNFEAALTDLTDLNDIDSLYNRGNALAMLYRLNEAIDIYRRVLSIDPGHEAAATNLEIVATLRARLTDDPGTDLKIEREEGEEADPTNSDSSQEITGETNGQENEQNQQDSSESISQQESQSADGNTGNSHLEDAQSAKEQELSAALERELSLQQWLGRIKDDPGTLLRNKFELQRKAGSVDELNLLALENNRQLW